jgi:hypothetical protein
MVLQLDEEISGPSTLNSPDDQDTKHWIPLTYHFPPGASQRSKQALGVGVRRRLTAGSSHKAFVLDAKRRVLRQSMRMPT